MLNIYSKSIRITSFWKLQMLIVLQTELMHSILQIAGFLCFLCFLIRFLI